jgi:hypothetical protein
MSGNRINNLLLLFIAGRPLKQGLFFLLCMGIFPLQAQQIPVKAGMKINRTVKIATRIYKVNITGDKPNSVIEIAGNNIVVDFNSAVLDGNVNGTLPDKFSGTAVIITGGKISP